VYTHIVTGTDGSETATEAVRTATNLAATCAATLHIVCVMGTGAPLGGSYEPIPLPTPADWFKTVQAESNTILQTAGEIAKDAGVEYKLHQGEGDPAGTILRIAEELDADLIVVGNRGMKGIARFVLGSVPNTIAHHAPCSVMIVRTT
jgi:nucleotide-binding universal stress UspA family protein